MAKEKGMFGGGNPNGLYVPITETEQEAIARLVASEDLEIVIKGWGVVSKPTITFGDLRVACHFRMSFNRPEFPMPVHFFDLELRTRSGLSLYKERQPSMYNGQPLQISAGMYLDLVWDIALRHLDPKLVKALVPHAWGLTSLRQDKDTGEMTLQGNMHLNSEQQAVLGLLDSGEKSTKQRDLANAIKVTERAGYKVTVTNDGVIAPEVID